jgi:hypothetical protein
MESCLGVFWKSIQLSARALRLRIPFLPAIGECPVGCHTYQFWQVVNAKENT